MPLTGHTSTGTQPALPHKPRHVLVTGASGLIGSSIALELLSLGHSVRLALRQPKHIKDWEETYGKLYEPGRIEYWLLGRDMGEEGAFEDAVLGCDAVVHAASPMPGTLKDDPEYEMLDPAINGALSILRSAAKSASVQSLSAFLDRQELRRNPHTTLTDESWNPTTYEQAARLPPSPQRASFVYGASKALAERACWDYIQQKQPDMTFCTFGPAVALGRDRTPGVKTVSDLHSSVGKAAQVLFGDDELNPPAFVSLHDVAHAHALAATSFSHTTNGKRYLLIGHRSSFEEVAEIVGGKRPELRKLMREKKGGAVMDEYGWKSRRVERDLGFTYQPLVEYVGDFADQVYELMHAAGQV
ncbi:bifunctional dihydroflavonol 4-reductase/flavanone 4-reductase [Rhodotorula toruloides]|uniref:Bifunctional dihydroflavonol 4-reductase/flavanone 4-reductase n=1 Tax=Rhodotorula toruloides TaxID=5286 RepID=A0A511KPT3_RHOTO|nr:bifunctional dihydroflavonol 4-reductase/flavanone 4-reductase [Rhodotorula toruloides]